MGFDWENFDVLDRWPLTRGGRLREVVVHGGHGGSTVNIYFLREREVVMLNRVKFLWVKNL